MGKVAWTVAKQAAIPSAKQPDYSHSNYTHMACLYDLASLHAQHNTARTSFTFRRGLRRAQLLCEEALLGLPRPWPKHL